MRINIETSTVSLDGSCETHGDARRMEPSEVGRRGEEAAQAYLRRHGYEILETNWSCIAGEVDIIARDDDTLHFVEVKTRRDIRCGFPSDAVTEEKRARYEMIAALYLESHDAVDVYVCFDVISIMVTGPDRAFLRMHPNAFCVE